MKFLDYLKCDWVQGENRIVLTDILRFFDGDNIHRIPVEFYSDGASIPRPLWPVIGHPFDEDIRRPAVLHDFKYYSGQDPRREADRLLRVAMHSEGAKWYKSWTVWSGVRLGGWVAWNKYRRDQLR